MFSWNMGREMGKVRQSPTEEGLRVPLLLDRGTPMLPVSQLAGTLVGELDLWALYWQGKVIKNPFMEPSRWLRG